MAIQFTRQRRAVWLSSASFATALLFITGFATADRVEAQQADFLPIQQVAATSAPQQSGPSPIEELQRRLDQQALEIQQLQMQLNGGGTQATPAAYISGAGVGTPPCPCGPDGLPMCQPTPPAASCCSEITNDPVRLTAFWNNGLVFQTANQEFKVHVGGRINFDAFNAFDAQKSVEFAHGGLGAFEESQGFRRARVRMDGTIFDDIDFVSEYDFTTAVLNPKNLQSTQGTTLFNPNGSSVFAGSGITDMYATMKYLPYIGNLSVGSFQVPYSFELATSDRFSNFTERSAAFDAFAPAPNNTNRTLGALAFNWNESKTITYQASASLNNMWDGASGFDFGNDPMFAGRVTALPYYDASTDGRYLVHLGLDGVAAHCQADPLVAGSPDATQLRARDNTREYLSPLTQSITNTGVIDGDYQYFAGAELVSVWGPWTWESELYGSWVTDDNGAGKVGADTLFFSGGYASLMYFITGENRVYNRERACFDRVVPYEDYVRMPGDYGRACGWGAWQVGLRYSYVDLNDLHVFGGQENEITLGVNWFLNPNLKYQLDYSATYRDNEVSSGNSASNGWINGFSLRLALDF